MGEDSGAKRRCGGARGTAAALRGTTGVTRQRPSGHRPWTSFPSWRGVHGRTAEPGRGGQTPAPVSGGAPAGGGTGTDARRRRRFRTPDAASRPPRTTMTASQKRGPAGPFSAGPVFPSSKPSPYPEDPRSPSRERSQ